MSKFTPAQIKIIRGAVAKALFHTNYDKRLQGLIVEYVIAILKDK